MNTQLEQKSTDKGNLIKKQTSKTFPPKRGKISRIYMSQTEVPIYNLDNALRIPKAIIENYASEPVTPLKVALALKMTPLSGGFVSLCGSAIGYGLTSGGSKANEIKVENLAKRIIKPLEEGDALRAKQEAFLKPRVFGEFLKKYDGSSIPREDIAENVLLDMGVPKERIKSVFRTIIEGARQLDLIHEIKDKSFVELSGLILKKGPEEQSIQETDEITAPETIVKDFAKEEKIVDSVKKRRVFVTHGKNISFIEPIKKFLQFGELEAIISVEKQSVSQPVPDKVMNDMRSCGAAIIHVDAEMKLFNMEGKEYVVINPNVLIEIGAAMALFGRRFILLVKEGVTLPSNLQGLYEVRYSGDSLDANATVKLLEAINEMKKYPMPEEAK